jgi:hypothetical protein
MVSVNTKEIEAWKTKLAKRLIACAVAFQVEHRKRLSVAFPPASILGEYPHGRTWQGRANSGLYAPQTPDGVKLAGLKIKIGQAASTWYMIHLERNKGRLGYEKTMADILPKLRSILMTGAK